MPRIIEVCYSPPCYRQINHIAALKGLSIVSDFFIIVMLQMFHIVPMNKNAPIFHGNPSRLRLFSP